MTNQAHPHVELGNGPESTQSFSTDRLADRWYSPLLEGTQPDLWLIQKALGVDTRRSSALLGAAWVHRLCTAFGTQSSRQNRVAAMLVAEMCSRDPSLPLPDSWSKHLRKPSTKTAISELFRSALTQSQKQLDVLVVSLTHPDHGLKDAPISGTSIFLKLGVALAGIASQIEPAKLDSLNHLAVVLGMEIDRSGGTLTQEIRDGTLATLHPCTPPIDTGSSASLASMVPCLQHHKHPAFHNTLERVLTAIRSSAIAPMNHYSWSPVVVQHTASLVDTRETDLLKILGPFTREVNGPLLQAFASLTKNSSASLSAALSSLHDSGGKRLRPLLLLLAAEACGHSPNQSMSAAAVVEWLHQASLVLDDWMDNAPLRRGVPTIHSCGNPSMAFGVFLFLIARIYQALRGEDGIPSDEVFHAAMAMAHGQWLEWRHTGDLTLTSDTLNEILTHKTSQLFASATRIGALQAQAEPQVVRGLSDYGLAIGTAFQITDDILDVCGATQRLGKQVGTDLCAHKVTLPIVLLLKQLTGSDRERMMQMVDPTHQVSQDDLIWVRNQVTLHGIDRQCKEEANRHLRKAIVALEVLPESEAKHILIALALHMADRWS